MRVIVFWGLHGGPPVSGNYHIGVTWGSHMEGAK